MLKIEGCIGNHAVLQHNKNIVISGNAAPKHHIRFKLGDITATVLSSDEGYFRVILPPMDPAGPLSLQISDIDGNYQLTYCDIYIGNVYLLSGQSNMALTLGKKSNTCQKYSDNLIRQFSVKKQALACSRHFLEEHWQIASGDALENFLAIGFHFARELRSHLPKIAIGLLDASYGGTNIEAWISRESLLTNPITQKETEAYELNFSQIPASLWQVPSERGELEQKMLEDLFPAPFSNLGVDQAWHTKNFDDEDWAEMILPESWTLTGCNSPGVFWFRRAIELPTAWKNQNLSLHLGAIDKQDITYWNGVEAGHTGEGLDMTHANDLRCYPIASELVHDEINQIAVRALSFFSTCADGGLIGPDYEMYLTCEKDPEQRISLTGNWKYHLEQLITTEAIKHCRRIGPGEPHSYHIMFDNMIAPLLDCQLAAIVFYQGEANSIDGTDTYEELLKLLIKDWKNHFAQPDLPFLIVQLPGFQTPRLYSEHSPWAKIRDAQLKVGLSLGIPPIVLAESGLAYDLHPPNKSIVGKRLAMQVLALQGKGDFPISGPVYRCMEKLSEGKIRIHFELYGSTLVVKGDCVNHLVIAGANGVFHEAKSQSDSPETLLVWSDAVAHPEVVRYGWCENPAYANLYNQADQPASPFRTDTEYNFS